MISTDCLSSFLLSKMKAPSSIQRRLFNEKILLVEGVQCAFTCCSGAVCFEMAILEVEIYVVVREVSGFECLAGISSWSMHSCAACII